MRPILAALAMVLVGTDFCPSFLHAAEPDVGEQQIRRLIEQLDDDRFTRRADATAQLIKIGTAALPQLQRATGSRSAEVRSRARRIIYLTVTVKIRGELIKLAGVKQDKQFDIERGMWLLARIVDPQVKKKDLDRQLDALAARVRKRVAEKHGKEVQPKTLSPTEAVAALRQVIFTEAGFTGNVADYDNPINSSLQHVLKTRKGLPILLSHVVMAVGRRLEIPIVGLGLSGRYMCMYDGSRAPRGAEANIVINPFVAGEILTLQELTNVIPGFRPTSSLSADGNRSALQRMMLNLASDYDAVGNARMAAQVYDFQELFYPVTTDDW